MRSALNKVFLDYNQFDQLYIDNDDEEFKQMLEFDDEEDDDDHEILSESKKKDDEIDKFCNIDFVTERVNCAAHDLQLPIKNVLDGDDDKHDIQSVISELLNMY